jgi:alpha-tubulin suppressor-like RCC1 family protein
MVACGKNFTVILGKNEKVYTFGNGNFGVLGHGSYIGCLESKFVEALSSENIVKICAGWSHVLALSS